MSELLHLRLTVKYAVGLESVNAKTFLFRKIPFSPWPLNYIFKEFNGTLQIRNILSHILVLPTLVRHSQTSKLTQQQSHNDMQFIMKYLAIMVVCGFVITNVNSVQTCTNDSQCGENRKFLSTISLIVLRITMSLM